MSQYEIVIRLFALSRRELPHRCRVESYAWFPCALATVLQGVEEGGDVTDESTGALS